MLKIKKFLYFIELESGVNFIGYVGIFTSLILSIAFLLTSAFSFNDVIAYIKERYVVHKTDLPGIQIFIIFVIVLASLLINIYTSISLIRGVLNQNHKLFKPYLGTFPHFTINEVYYISGSTKQTIHVD
ncbi:hypothetical protein PVAND_007739 [Polypedilum vanderplanki]|uniref:Uncharacterized protein n=1 Tax=Polypedilum vanderplanki TaxID=319348 RepID=A0A9J6C853_POLVA|nr:hypothetical protein PVAND_007739 [Polypedilum vanderplanki]